MAEENTIEQNNRDRDEDEADAGGADSAQAKAEQREEGEPAAGGTGDDQSEESRKAQEKEEEREKARERMDEIEEDPPENLEDWPDDAAKYETFGGPEGEHSYEEGPEQQLGPSSLRHHEDGKITVEGDEVDDPDEYKAEPIPGGPTDSQTPRGYGEPDLSEEGKPDPQGQGDSEKDEEKDEERDDEKDEARD
jgi:hypothetical protein